MNTTRRIVCRLAVVWILALQGIASANGAAPDSTSVPAAAPDSTSVPAASTAAKAAPEVISLRAVPDSISRSVDSTLVSRLREGGYVVFLRHSLTNWEERDTQESDFSSRANQRNLSKEGRLQAAEIGRAVAALKIPIEKVLASPMWRARDTAELAFGAYDTTGTLFFKGPQFREARIKMLSTVPAEGKNMIFVGHQDPLLPIVPGLKRDQVREGDALIIQPLGEGKFRVIVQVSPADWARLAGLPAPAAAAAGATAAVRAPGATAPPDSTYKH